MQDVLKFISILLFPAVFWYGLFALIEFDINMANWHIVTRIVFLLFYVLSLNKLMDKYYGKDDDSRENTGS